MTSPDQEYVIRARGVRKTYVNGVFRRRRTEALRNVDFEVKRGALFGLLGPNGAGKTTLLNICSTLLVPDAGTVSLFGSDLSRVVSSRLQDIRSRINMTSGSPNFPWSLTVCEVLNFYGMLYGIAAPLRRKRVEESIELLELGRHAGTRYDRLSSGTKQRLALAKVLINDPELMFLDEPTIGLDPDIAVRLRRLIRTIHGRGTKTIVLTTHYMKEAEELCGHIAFMRDGAIVAEGTSEELKKRLDADDLEEVFLELAR